MQALKKVLFIFLFAAGAFSCLAQNPYAILQRDTIIEGGTQLTLCIDSVKAYSNFIFSAQNPETGKWTIWRKNAVSNKYEPVFDDRYNRAHVVVSADKGEMIYVRYRQQRVGSMHDASLDSAWICRSTVDGRKEEPIFLVPQFSKNAIYDLDWSADKQRILYAWGNDAYPTLTRDGDIFEYDQSTGKHTNLTRNYELWNNHCRYGPDSKSFAYSHYANFWYSRPTDIYIKTDNDNVQQTNNFRHAEGWQYCTLTDYTGDQLLYRRGEFSENKLFVKKLTGEDLLLNRPGYGGVRLGSNFYAATDTTNNILLFTESEIAGSIRLSGINNFGNDDRYNFGQDCNTRLNWLGKQPVKIEWSTGDTTFAIQVQPRKNTTYQCTITANGNKYTYSVKVKTGKTRPTIVKNCFTLSVAGFSAYQWLMNNTPLAGATDSSYTPQSGGVYAVKATDGKGRTTLSYEMNVTGTETDSLNALNESIKVTPDPATNTVKITSSVPVNLMAINEQGRIIEQKDNAHELNMANLPDGDYSIILYDNNCIRLKSRKISKK